MVAEIRLCETQPLRQQSCYHHPFIPLFVASTFTIQLHHLHFTAPHGLYGEEALVKNEFEVNLSLTTRAPEKTVTSIDDTINYATVYTIVKEVFSGRKLLLETLAMEIAEAVKKAFPRLDHVSIQIIKLHPPIEAFTGAVSVTFTHTFES